MTYQVPTRLVRSWQRMFGTRGGDTPRADAGIVPVVLIDDHSTGGYTGGQRWIKYGRQIAGAANYSSISIANMDGVTTGGQNLALRKSIVVVDGFWWFIEVTNSDLHIGWGQTPVASGTVPVWAMDTSPDAPEGIGIPIANVQMRTELNVTDLSAGAYPFIKIPAFNSQVGNVFRDGGWTLGPTQRMSFSPSQVNVGLMLVAWGRYYPPE